MGMPLSIITNTISDIARKLKQVPDSCLGDERRNHLRFVQEAEVVQLMKYAIRYGDIGLIKWGLDRLVVLFSGSSSRNYAKEVLYSKHLIGTDYCSPEL